MATLSLTYGEEYFETGDTIIGNSLWTNYSETVAFVNGLANGSNFNPAVIPAEALATNSVTTAKVAGNAITLDKLAAAVANALVPIGSVVPYAGAAAPNTAWMLADGTAVSRTAYSELFNLIGTLYGSGDGSTTFNLPNLKGRVPVGLDSAQAAFDTRGETGGSATHTLSTAEIPSHSHADTATWSQTGFPTILDTGHAHHANTGYTGSHNHSNTVESTSATGEAHSHGTTGTAGNPDGSNTTGLDYDNETVHYHDFNTDSGTANIQVNGSVSGSVSITPSNTGGSGAHNNLQPYQVVNYLIKVS